MDTESLFHAVSENGAVICGCRFSPILSSARKPRGQPAVPIPLPVKCHMLKSLRINTAVWWEGCCCTGAAGKKSLLLMNGLSWPKKKTQTKPPKHQALLSKQRWHYHVKKCVCKHPAFKHSTQSEVKVLMKRCTVTFWVSACKSNLHAVHIGWIYTYHIILYMLGCNFIARLQIWCELTSVHLYTSIQTKALARGALSHCTLHMDCAL